MSEDPLLLRGAASPIGAPVARGRALARMREDLVRGRLEQAPLLAWLGPSVGRIVLEACVRAGLPSRCRARREEAEEALSCLLDCLERALSMQDLASARGETSIAALVLEQTLEAGLVAPRREAPGVSAPETRERTLSTSTSTRVPPRRPPESVERLRSLRSATR